MEAMLPRAILSGGHVIGSHVTEGLSYQEAMLLEAMLPRGYLIRRPCYWKPCYRGLSYQEAMLLEAMLPRAILSGDHVIGSHVTEGLSYQEAMLLEAMLLRGYLIKWPCYRGPYYRVKRPGHIYLIILAPNGISASFANLKCCFPKGSL